MRIDGGGSLPLRLKYRRYWAQVCRGGEGANCVGARQMTVSPHLLASSREARGRTYCTVLAHTVRTVQYIASIMLCSIGSALVPSFAFSPKAFSLDGRCFDISTAISSDLCFGNKLDNGVAKGPAYSRLQHL
jgi:hypothetical protein